MITDAKIAEIRERADLVEIVGEYVTLRRAGANMKGVCPFHADSDPSFNVNPARQFYHCFGCGASGDVFKFLQNVEGLEFMEAVERLAARYGVELPSRETTPAARTAQDKAREASRRRRQVLEVATAFFEARLAAPEGKPARDLLDARGIGRETAALFRLGYAPDSWQTLLDHLREQRISPQEAVDVGLALPRKTGPGFYDRFRNRLVFTITDQSGHPIAFSARALEGVEDPGAKYINSPETPEYTKGKVLFGLNQARVALSKEKEAILVEGNFDVVAAAQAGIRNVVAPLGTALTEEQAALLRRRVERVTVMFDGDKAGRAAAARAFPLLARAGLAAYVAVLPDGHDPDSLARKGGRAALEALLAGRRGLLDEIVRSSAAACDGSAQDVARRVAKLGPFLDAVKDPMERDVYRQRVADAFSIEPKLVFRYLRSKDAGVAEVQSPQEAAPSRRDTEERELVGLLMDLPELCDEAMNLGVLASMRSDALRKVAQDLVEMRKRKDSNLSSLVSAAAGEAATAWIARRGMERLYTEPEKGRKALSEIAARLGRRELHEAMAQLNQRIRLANAAGDQLKVLELQRQRTELEKEATKADLAFDKGQNGD